MVLSSTDDDSDDSPPVVVERPTVAAGQTKSATKASTQSTTAPKKQGTRSTPQKSKSKGTWTSPRRQQQPLPPTPLDDDIDDDDDSQVSLKKPSRGTKGLTKTNQSKKVARSSSSLQAHKKGQKKQHPPPSDDDEEEDEPEFGELASALSDAEDAVRQVMETMVRKPTAAKTTSVRTKDAKTTTAKTTASKRSAKKTQDGVRAAKKTKKASKASKSRGSGNEDDTNNDDENEGMGSRDKNWTELEFVLLTHAYINATQDVINGGNNRSTNFWAKVESNLEELWMQKSEYQNASDSLDPQNQVQWSRKGINAVALSRKWGKGLAQIRAFHSVHDMIRQRNPSGWNDEMIYKEALRQYYQQKPRAEKSIATGELAFPYRRSWELLAAFDEENGGDDNTILVKKFEAKPNPRHGGYEAIGDIDDEDDDIEEGSNRDNELETRDDASQDSGDHAAGLGGRPTLSASKNSKNRSSSSTKKSQQHKLAAVNRSSGINLHLSRPAGVKQSKTALDKLKKNFSEQRKAILSNNAIGSKVAEDISAAAQSIPHAINALSGLVSTQQAAFASMSAPVQPVSTINHEDVALLGFLPEAQRVNFATKLYEARLSEIEINKLRLDLDKKELEVRHMVVDSSRANLNRQQNTTIDRGLAVSSADQHDSILRDKDEMEGTDGMAPEDPDHLDSGIDEEIGNGDDEKNATSEANDDDNTNH